MFKNYTPFTSCISRTNNTEVDDAQYIDVVMPVYNLIEYSDNYSKTPGILWQYCRDGPATNINNYNIEFIDFTDANLTVSFNLKVKLTCKTGGNGTKNVAIIVPLKYPSNFWRTLEIPSINCEITFDINWSENFVIMVTKTQHFQ